jgi:diguanylate cyclase
VHARGTVTVTRPDRDTGTRVDTARRAGPARRALLGPAAVGIAFLAHAATVDVGGWRGYGGESGNTVAYYAALIVPLAWAFPAVARADRGRRGWRLIVAGLALWTLGDLAWVAFVPATVETSWVDGMYLAFYPLAGAGLVVLVRTHAADVGLGPWLDGIVGGIAAAAIGATIFEPALRITGGNRVDVAVNLVYPFADLLLVLLATMAVIVTVGATARSFTWLAVGLAAFAIGDTIYLLRSANGTYLDGGVHELTWTGGFALMALAARTHDVGTPRSRPERLSTIAWMPMALATTALALVAIHLVRTGASLGAWVALAAVTASLPRFLLAGLDTRRLRQARLDAHTDALTGLPNRRAYYLAVDGWLERAASGTGSDGYGGGESLAVIVLDLNGFKDVNDGYGHAAGDEVLAQLGQRLRATVRPDDDVVRLAGDEFVVVSRCLRSNAHAEAEDTAARLVDALAQPVDIGEASFRLGASAGIARHPEHGATADELLAAADLAMYAAKRGRSAFRTYEVDATYVERDRLRRLHELRQALDGGELVLAYQPQAATCTGIVQHVEALVRWDHPTRGRLGPAEFLPLVASAGLDARVTEIVMCQALAQLAAWRADGLDLTVSVNVTASDLLGDHLVPLVADALDRHRVPPWRLIVEITEESLVTDLDRAAWCVTELRDLGVAVAVDDFGVGYSSLSQLQHLVVDELKLDRSLLASCRTNARADAVVRSAITLAHGLGMVAVAEGVEDTETWRHLGDLGCDRIQGYRLSPPIPADAVPSFVARAQQSLAVVEGARATADFDEEDEVVDPV